ncbi:protein of unassigned function [Methylobacterium oryzae CBMB20]|uniref:Protein of unassigned function n=1 Tax=Methylobacterium oryzae CBMB20 TaxID=693986 RepID=A0A089P1U2_9HYPH|nr:protein of unassigned function [Methylobacterium oryzae CBMB20]
MPERSGVLEGRLQPDARSLEPSFGGRCCGHLRMRAWVGQMFTPDRSRRCFT